MTTVATKVRRHYIKHKLRWKSWERTPEEESL